MDVGNHFVVIVDNLIHVVIHVASVVVESHVVTLNTVIHAESMTHVAIVHVICVTTESHVNHF